MDDLTRDKASPSSNDPGDQFSQLLLQYIQRMSESYPFDPLSRERIIALEKRIKNNEISA